MTLFFKNAMRAIHQKGIQRSLSVDLTIGMVVIIVLIEGALLYFMYQRQSRLLQTEIEFKADDYASKLSEVLAVPIWDFDDEQIKKIGEGFHQNELVRRIRITSNQGNQILLLENEGEDSLMIRRDAEIRYNQQTIGHVEIFISAASYLKEMGWLRNTLIVVLLCSIIVIFLASGLLLRLFLRKPLRALAQGMDRVAKGEFDHQTKNLSYTELTDIAERFNQMASRIKARENALVDINQELKELNAQLRQRFKYEQLLAEMSTHAASSTSYRQFVEESLRSLGEALGATWIGLYRNRSNDDCLTLTSEWPSGETFKRPSRIIMVAAGLGTELFHSLRANQPIKLDHKQLHTQDSADDVFFSPSLKTLLALPLFVKNTFYGGVLFGDVAETRKWEDVAPILETATQIIVRFIESMQAQTLLLRSEERFREMAEMLPETIFEMDDDGQLTYVNQSGLEQFGYSHRDLQKGLRAFDMFVAADLPQLQKNIQAILDGKATRLKEYRACHKNGSQFPTMVSSSPIRKGDQVTGVRGFVIDISDKKNLEERLRKANRMEAIGNLAAGVAHDLNNILSGLVGYPDLLLLDLPAESPMRPPIQAIKETGHKAAAVVQDLLTLARRNISEAQIINLNDVVEDYLKSPEYLQLKNRHDTINITFQLVDDVMNVLSSAHHLSKALMNLVVNAMEAMPAGGDLQIRTANCYVDSVLAGYEDIPEGEYAVLSVIDSGIGISSDDMSNIFEPFYTKKRMGRSGTGLGMSVVWATVKDRAGFVDVDSKEGQGTRFDLYFPATREKAAPQPTHIPIEDYLGSEQILVVDDIPEQRRIAADMLGRLGYAVQTVSSGEAAVELIQHQAMDLVILDMIMDPGIDGLETYQRILAVVPNQKAIIASGFAETERVKTALKLGARNYLKKPYTLEKLGVTVRAALDHRAHRTQH